MAQVAVATNAPKASSKEISAYAEKMGAKTNFSAGEAASATLINSVLLSALDALRGRLGSDYEYEQGGIDGEGHRPCPARGVSGPPPASTKADRRASSTIARAHGRPVRLRLAVAMLLLGKLRHCGS
jgi:hypothetical protein